MNRPLSGFNGLRLIIEQKEYQILKLCRWLPFDADGVQFLLHHPFEVRVEIKFVHLKLPILRFSNDQQGFAKDVRGSPALPKRESLCVGSLCCLSFAVRAI